MAFSLFGLLLSCILFANAICILNDQRFLHKYGLGYIPGEPTDDSIKSKIVYLMYYTRSILRIPLLILNIFAILVLVIFG